MARFLRGGRKVNRDLLSPQTVTDLIINRRMSSKWRMPEYVC